MKIAIQTLGTRGDVQPYVALAKGLQARGHKVLLAGPEQLEGIATAHGIAYRGLAAEFLALLDTPEGKAAVAGGQGFSAGFKLLKHVRPMMARLLADEWRGLKEFGPDAIIYHPKSITPPYAAAKLGIPLLLASPLPGFTPTAAFPTPLLPFRSLGPLNKASHALLAGAAATIFRKEIKAWQREAMGGTIRPRRPTGTLYAYSRHVLERPDDWGEDVAVTGYWWLDQPDWVPDSELAAFLAAGDKPIYVGFGSMPGLDPARLSEMVRAALAATGKRGLLLKGGGALGAVRGDARVHFIDSAPHDKLLPLTDAAIHHGGAGTTAAALRAGLPSTICPFFGDQPFWARRLVELGVGAAPLNRKTLSVEAIATAIRAMDDPAMRQRAAALGEALRAEDGVGAAVDFIEAIVARG